MDNKVDVSKFALIEEIAFVNSKLLKCGYAYYRYGNKKEEASIFFLRGIVSGNVDDILERINLTYARVCNTHNSFLVINNVQYILAYLIWARLCVLAYYFYEDDAIWKKFIFNKLEEKISSEELKREVIAAKQSIDKLHREQEELRVANEELLKTNNPSKSEPSQQKDVEDDLPCLIRTMQDIQDGKINNLNAVSWGQEIGEMVRLCKIMPTQFPPVFWLWSVLGIIEEPTKRMDVLGKIQDAAHECFDSKKEELDFIRDCDSLVKINGRIREYYLRNDTDKSDIWTDERKCLNGIAHLYSDKYVHPEFLVAIAEDIYCSAQNKEKPKILTLLLRADQYTNRMSMDNIFEFSKALYVAEGFRQLFISGKEDYFEFPTIASFNWKLRNACFDVYIDLRLKQIREDLEEDNTRVMGPDDVECIEYLLEEEQMAVSRENMFEDFRGSSAYEAMWFRGRGMVLDMINVFSEYLQKRLEQAKAEKKLMQERENLRLALISQQKKLKSEVEELAYRNINNENENEDIGAAVNADKEKTVPDLSIDSVRISCLKEVHDELVKQQNVKFKGGSQWYYVYRLMMDNRTYEKNVYTQFISDLEQAGVKKLPDKNTFSRKKQQMKEDPPFPNWKVAAGKKQATLNEGKKIASIAFSILYM